MRRRRRRAIGRAIRRWALAAGGAAVVAGLAALGRYAAREGWFAGSPAAGSCPPEMAPIHSDGEVRFCVDRYEVVVSGANGEEDPLKTGAPLVTAPAAGQAPTIRVSFALAVEACANTPAIGAEGRRYGQKRLIRLDEWRDAADGQIGDGGLRYPYGDAWDDDACATPTADGEMPWAGIQPSGSFPDCVSPFGVFDQAGNAAEWVDPGWRLDIEGWLARAASRGISLRAGEDGRLYMDSGDGAPLQPILHGVLRGEVQVDADGAVWLRSAEALPTREARGFLRFHGERGQSAAEGYLPVKVGAPDDASMTAAPLYLDVGSDGAPLPAKVGCAYYVGDADACGIDHVYVGHPPDFDGTITFRCAADPSPGG